MREPQGNGWAERFVRKLKEQLLWLQRFETIEESRWALHEFMGRYNEEWLIERHGMTLPRLRVRELLFLVVYAALIGQAFVLSYVETGLPSRCLPSDVPGYLWVPNAEAIDILLLEQYRGEGLRTIVVSGSGVTISQGSDSKPNLMRSRIDARGEAYMLVPEELVK